MSRTFEEKQEIRADVQARYPHITFPDVVLEPVWFGRRPENRIPGRHAIVDQNNDKVFNICTDIYQLFYHEEIVHQVETAAAMMPEFGKPEIKVTLLADGGKIKVNCRFPDVDYEIRPGDTVNPTADVLSSYDLGWKYGTMFGAYRLVCSNGMTVGEVFGRLKKRHLTSLDVKEMQDTLTNGMTKFSEQVGLWQKWADEKILPDMYSNVWEELPFSEPEREKIEHLKEAGTGLYLPEALKSGDLTRWGLFNTLTQFATHEIKSQLRVVEVMPEITRAMERLAA